MIAPCGSRITCRLGGPTLQQQQERDGAVDDRFVRREVGELIVIDADVALEVLEFWVFKRIELEAVVDLLRDGAVDDAADRQVIGEFVEQMVRPAGVAAVRRNADHHRNAPRIAAEDPVAGLGGEFAVGGVAGHQFVEPRLRGEGDDVVGRAPHERRAQAIRILLGPLADAFEAGAVVAGESRLRGGVDVWIEPPVGEVHVGEELVVAVVVGAHPGIVAGLVGVFDRVAEVLFVFGGDVKFRRGPFKVVEVARLAVVVGRTDRHRHGDAGLRLGEFVERFGGVEVAGEHHRGGGSAREIRQAGRLVLVLRSFGCAGRSPRGAGSAGAATVVGFVVVPQRVRRHVIAVVADLDVEHVRARMQFLHQVAP